MQTSKSQGLTDMRRQHPEWCLGDDAPNWCTTSWNMAIPEVREHKLDLIEQACRLADWDGVELDWQRHAFHLPGKHEYRLRYALTDLQRAIRRMTDGIAEERGRPFPVAVRVGATLEACRNIGYDVETWVNEGLCDIIIGGGNSGTDPCFETEEFLSLVEGTNILVYPGYELREQAGRQPPHSPFRVAQLVVRRDVAGPLRARGAWHLCIQLARRRDHPPRVAHFNRLAGKRCDERTRPTLLSREASPTTRSARTPSATTGSTARFL